MGIQLSVLEERLSHHGSRRRLRLVPECIDRQQLHLRVAGRYRRGQ